MLKSFLVLLKQAYNELLKVSVKSWQLAIFHVSKNAQEDVDKTLPQNNQQTNQLGNPDETHWCYFNFLVHEIT